VSTWFCSLPPLVSTWGINFVDSTNPETKFWRRCNGYALAIFLAKKICLESSFNSFARMSNSTRFRLFRLITWNDFFCGDWRFAAIKLKKWCKVWLFLECKENRDVQITRNWLEKSRDSTQTRLGQGQRLGLTWLERISNACDEARTLQGLRLDLWPKVGNVNMSLHQSFILQLNRLCNPWLYKFISVPHLNLKTFGITTVGSAFLIGGSEIKFDGHIFNWT